MIVNFDYTVLKARIKERFGTYHAFAAALGVPSSCTALRLVSYCVSNRLY